MNGAAGGGVMGGGGLLLPTAVLVVFPVLTLACICALSKHAYMSGLCMSAGFLDGLAARALEMGHCLADATSH